MTEALVHTTEVALKTLFVSIGANSFDFKSWLIL